MTREEALNKIGELVVYARVQGWDDEFTEAFETLSAKPCEDTISRQAVLSMQYRIDDSATLSTRDVVNVDDIEDLPPVTPQPKIGHWIFDDKCKEHGHCSLCNYGSVDLMDGEPHDFCRRCGAKMAEVESEGVG